MNKIYVVLDKNEEIDRYEPKTIVIFKDNNGPEIINYNSVNDLFPIIKFAEENGFDILKDGGLRPAIEAGLIEPISMSDEKAMNNLKGNIIMEELGFAGKNEKEEVKEEGISLVKELKPASLNSEEEKVELPTEEATEVEAPVVEEPVEEKIEEEPIEESVEENKITKETTMFKPVNGNVDLPIEEREYAEYLKLNILRSKNQLDEAGLLKIKQLASYNDKVAKMEALREEVINAEKNVKELTRFNGESLPAAVTKLNQKQKEYNNLAIEYRKDLANAIKKFANIEKIEEKEENNEEVFTEEENDVIKPRHSNGLFTEDSGVPGKHAKKEEIIEDSKEENDESLFTEEENNIIKPRHSNGIFTEDSGVPGKHAKKEEVIDEDNSRSTNSEEEKDDDYKPDFILVNDNQEKDAKGIHPETDEEYPIIVRDADGNEETITAKTTSKFKKFMKKVGAFLLGVVVGALGYLGLDTLIKKHNQNNTVKVETQITREIPINSEVETPTVKPTVEPTVKPVATPTAKPTVEPTAKQKTTTTEKPKTTTTEKPKTTTTAQPAATTTTNTATAKPTVAPTPVVLNVSSVMANYMDKYNVPEATRIFLQQPEVIQFMSQFTNEAQAEEVLSALCFGYEANILTTKDGNFKLDEDGNTYLTSFTHDFLCAKVVVNRYNARQMVTVFGEEVPSYEELMKGFQAYTHYVRTYFMTATERLPFQYLTNGNQVSTRELNELQDKIIIVNKNREDHTLTSTMTDDFIAKVFDLYVVNDGTINMSEGAKTVGGAIVDAYCAMQSQVDQGEALYLHEDRGLAKAGINLCEIDGHFAIGYPDKTTYEFTSLYDVMNHGYGDVNETAARCVTQQEEIMASLNKALELDLSNVDEARRNLEYTLYQEGFDDYALKVHNGNISDRLLDEIAALNPIFADDVNAVRWGRENKGNDYVGFSTTYEGADRLLGISGRKSNDYATLINNRRNTVYLYKDYTVVKGKKYVGVKTQQKTEKKQQQSQQTQQKSDDSSKTETTVVVEKVEYEDLTPEEKVEVQEQIEEMQQQEEEKHEDTLQQVEERKETLQEAVVEGKTQAELEEMTSDIEGFTLSENYETEMGEAKKEQQEGEEKREAIEQQVEDNNKQAEAEAAERAEAERLRQEEERRQEEELIQASLELEAQEAAIEEHSPEATLETYEEATEGHDNLTNIDEGTSYSEDHSGEIDQNDPNRVDEEAGEEVYIPTADAEILRELRGQLLEEPVENTDELILVKRFNGRA